MGIKRRHFLKGSVAAGLYGAINPAASIAQSAADELITKTIPSTGEQLPVIGLGTNQYGVGGGEEERAPLREILRIYSENGGLVDTAASYGRSQAVIGELLGELGVADKMFMSTKCDRSGGEDTRNQLEVAHDQLDMDPIDLMEIHNLRSWKENLAVLREWKQQGRIRYLGITTSRNSQHQQLTDIMKTESLDFVQLNYSILDRAAEQTLLPVAADKGIAVLGNLPYARGRVFSAVSGQELPDWAKEFCQSWGQFFLKYNVSHPAMTACIPGTTTPRYALDNVGAMRGRLPDASERKMQEDFIATL